MDRKLREPEHDQMNRRHLLRALGIVTTGALMPGFTIRSVNAFASIAKDSATAGRSFPVTTVNHLNMTSANYARSRDFYVDLFGMRVAWDDGRQCALEFGNIASPNGMYIRPLTKPGEKPTIGHIAFGIPNFISQKAAMKAEMERRGVRNVRPDGEVGWSCDDPAGYPLNIWVPEKDKAMFPGAAGPCEIASSAKCKAAWERGVKNLGSAPKPNPHSFSSIGFSFIILNVPDVSKERDFYRDLLGMEVVADRTKSSDADCILAFGQNALVLRKLSNPAAKPYCNRFGLKVTDDVIAVEAELKRRSLKSEIDSKDGTRNIVDPDGYLVGVNGGQK